MNKVWKKLLTILALAQHSFLDIDNGWKITRITLQRSEKIVGLFEWVVDRFVEMVGASEYAAIFHTLPVLKERLILEMGALGRLGVREGNPALLERLPRYRTIVVGDIDTLDKRRIARTKIDHCGGADSVCATREIRRRFRSCTRCQDA